MKMHILSFTEELYSQTKNLHTPVREAQVTFVGKDIRFSPEKQAAGDSPEIGWWTMLELHYNRKLFPF